MYSVRATFEPLWWQEDLMLVLYSVVGDVRRYVSRPSGQCIWLCTLLARTILYYEVELGQELCPTGLSAIELFCRHKVFERLVIREDIYWIRCTCEFWSPFLESSYNRHELFVVNGVIQFCWFHFYREERYGPQDLIMVLREYPSDDPIRCVSLNDRLFVRVKVSQDGCFDKRVLEMLKGLTSCVVKFHFTNSSLRTLDQWTGHLRKTMNKPSVEVRKSHEGLDVLDGLW